MKQVKCELFGEGEYIWFNIGRLSRLENKLGKPIVAMLSGQIGITETVAAYVVGLAHVDKKRTKAWYEARMQELLESGTALDEIMMPALKAIIGSGIAGKAAYFEAFPDEMTERDKDEVIAEQDRDEKNG